MTEIKRDDRGREQVKAWYIIMVTSQRERVVTNRLRNLAKNPIWKDQIFRIFLPIKTVTDEKGKVKEEFIYNQTIYIEMILNDDTYHAVKIDGVRHILGDPTPVPEEDVKRQFEICGVPYEENESAEHSFENGTEIIVNDESKGAFHEQEGVITGYDEEQGLYHVSVTLAGREVTVSLTNTQFKKK